MPKTQPIILGIDPGARHVGVAVLRGRELLYYGVKTLKKNESSRPATANLEQLITKLAAEYRVDIIALEKVISAQQRKSYVKVVYENVQLIAGKYDFKLREYSPNLVRNFICSQVKATRRETYRALAEKYPELNRYVSVTRIWQKAYFARLLDAVAVALLGIRECEETEQLSIGASYSLEGKNKEAEKDK